MAAPATRLRTHVADLAGRAASRQEATVDDEPAADPCPQNTQ